MSQLMQLRDQLLSVGQDARRQAQALLAFKPRFDTAAGMVAHLIGGAATHTDLEMIAAIQAAQKKVDEAIIALQQAIAAAERYASRM